jgi:hypothetical protein
VSLTHSCHPHIAAMCVYMSLLCVPGDAACFYDCMLYCLLTLIGQYLRRHDVESWLALSRWMGGCERQFHSSLPIAQFGCRGWRRFAGCSCFLFWRCRSVHGCIIMLPSCATPSFAVRVCAHSCKDMLSEHAAPVTCPYKGALVIANSLPSNPLLPLSATWSTEPWPVMRPRPSVNLDLYFFGHGTTMRHPAS